MQTTPAPTDPEAGRRALLDDIKEDALSKEWTPEKSEIVDIIDTFNDGGYCG